VTSDTTPTFEGTAEVGSTVELLVDGKSLGTTNADDNDAWSFIPSNTLADGTYSITAKATDTAGNASEVGEALSVTVDTATPDTNITSGPEDTIASASAEFAFSSAEQGLSFKCKLEGGDYDSCQPPKTYTGLGDGQHTFSVRAIDAAGNADASPAERSFTVDATKPNAPTVTSPQNNSYDTDGNFAVSGTAEAGSTVELFEQTTSWGKSSVGKDGTWSIDLAGVADGEHTYAVRATDAAGNTSNVSNAVRVTVDTAAPSVNGVTPQDGATGVALADNVEVTFSEAMDPTTLNQDTFTLVEQGSATPLVATVTYDGATKKAILNPDADLQTNTTYTAIVNTDAKDAAGNRLATDKVWSFTAAASVS
jgi:hypothetical protein